MELKGKNAIVTGGDWGIGRAISFALANNGANVAICFFKDENKAQETVKKLEQIGVKALRVQTDVRDFGQVDRMMSMVKERLGSIDILVNNAGISTPRPAIESISIQDW